MTSSPSASTTFFGLDISGLSEQLTKWRRRFSKRVLLLDFHTHHLSLAEVRVSGDGELLNFDHIDQISLPDDAQERGVPTNPQAMANLIKQTCLEKKIPAHRCSVVLPPEVAFQKIIALPRDLSLEEARLHVLNPIAAGQIPIPLQKTDFDLIPTSLISSDNQHEFYLLLAIPLEIVEQILQVLNLAGLELVQMEIGSFSLLRLVASSFEVLQPYEVHGIIDLSADSSQLTFCLSSCPLQTDRLASIRLFPNPELDSDQFLQANENLISAESIVIEDERYLSISELDLRILNGEIKLSIDRFKERWPGFKLVGLSLLGINSAHPNLGKLLQEQFDFPVESRCPSLTSRLGSLQFDDKLLVVRGLSRLIGLGLGMLSSKTDTTSNVRENPLLNSILRLRQNNLGENINRQIINESALYPQQLPPNVDVGSSEIEVEVIMSSELVVDSVEEKPEESLEDEEWPSLSLDSEVVEVKDSAEEKPEESLEDEEWPSLSLDSEVVEVKDSAEEKPEESLEDEEWPSLSLDSEVVEVKDSAEEKPEESLEDEEWPSLSLDSEVVEVKDSAEEKPEESLEDEEWPSLSLDSEVVAVKDSAEEKPEESLEDEEWPSLSLDSEVVEVKDSAEEKPEESLEDEEWPSLSLDSEVVEVKDSAEEKPEESLEDEEWPSLSLDSEVVEVKDSAEEKPEESLEDEEWPSLSLDSEVVEVKDSAEEKPEESLEDEEWPSLSLDRGVANAEEGPSSNRNQKALQSNKDLAKVSRQLIEDDSSNLLGELRFPDD